MLFLRTPPWLPEHFAHGTTETASLGRPGTADGFPSSCIQPCAQLHLQLDLRPAIGDAVVPYVLLLGVLIFLPPCQDLRSLPFSFC